MVDRFYVGQRLRAVQDGAGCYKAGDEFVVAKGHNFDHTVRCSNINQPHYLFRSEAHCFEEIGAQALTPPSDESPVGERKQCLDFVRLIADQLPKVPPTDKTTIFMYREAARLIELLLCKRPTPQPERVTEARVEAAAKAMWERTHDGYWPKDAEADATECVNERGEPTRLTTADIYRGDARAALEASLSISSEGEGGESQLNRLQDAIKKTAAQGTYDELEIRRAVSFGLAELIVEARRNLPFVERT